MNIKRQDLYFETARLVLRPLEVSDYNVWRQGFLDRKVQQHKYDQEDGAKLDCDVVCFENIVAQHKVMMEKDDLYIWAMFDKKGNHIGMLNIVTIARGHFEWCELGYYVHNQFWRNGYAAEGVQAVLQLARDVLKFHRVEAHVNLDNHASQRLLDKLGFTYECIRKGFIYEFDAWTDNKVYAMNLHDIAPE